MIVSINSSNLQNSFPPVAVGQSNGYVPVETTRPRQGGIEHFRAVGSCHHQNASALRAEKSSWEIGIIVRKVWRGGVRRERVGSRESRERSGGGVLRRRVYKFRYSKKARTK